MFNAIAFSLWKQDVVRSLVFQWALLTTVCGVCAVFGWGVALNALIVGLAVAVPNTALGAWMGIRMLLGKVGAAGVLIGSLLKTLSSTVLIGIAFATLQDFGWVWHGFFAGLVSMVLSPMLFGLLARR